MTPNATLERGSRRKLYDKHGGEYEQERYGGDHMRSYLSERCKHLIGILQQTFGETAPLKILEIGCGTGLTLDALSRLPVKHDLFGIDFSTTMLRQANEKAKLSPNPPTVSQGNALALPFDDGEFDAVYATRFIHQFSHEQKKLIDREMRRVTRDGGISVIEYYARGFHWLRFWLGGRKGRSWKSYFAHYPTASEVRDVVGGHFKPIPLRVGGARVLRWLIGERGTAWVTRNACRFPLRVLLDEYFVVTRT